MNSSRDDALHDIAEAMFDFARRGDAARLEAYVAAGAPPDLADASGNTLLMLAAYHGHAESVRLLARLGADVDRTGDRGATPLAGAAMHDDAPVARALLEAGADPNAGEPDAETTARVFGSQRVLELLRDR